MELSEGTKKAARTAIQKIANTHDIDVVEIINCNVVSVDKSSRTCVVTPLSGKSDTTIEDVGLMPERNDGEFKIPKVDSTVGVVMSTFVDPYIVSWSELDEWYIVIGDNTIDMIDSLTKFNGGEYGGLIKVKDPEDTNKGLLKKINNLENLINDLINKYNSHVHPATLAVSGGSATGTTSVTTQLETGTIAPITSEADLTNADVAHGKITA